MSMRLSKLETLLLSGNSGGGRGLSGEEWLGGLC